MDIKIGTITRTIEKVGAVGTTEGTEDPKIEAFRQYDQRDQDGEIARGIIEEESQRVAQYMQAPPPPTTSVLSIYHK